MRFEGTHLEVRRTSPFFLSFRVGFSPRGICFSDFFSSLFSRAETTPFPRLVILDLSSRLFQPCHPERPRALARGSRGICFVFRGRGAPTEDSECRITSTPPIPLWFFRIITLQTISRHCIDSQWFTSIFFYCNSYNRVLPPARKLGKNEQSQLAVAQRPVFCWEPVVSDCQ